MRFSIAGRPLAARVGLLVAGLLFSTCGAWAQAIAPGIATRAGPVRFDPRMGQAPSFARENRGSDETRAQEAVRIEAADGVAIYGDFYAAAGQSRGTVLLFHDANSNRGEYAAIAPVFVKAGYNAMAIDQRAGGTRWGRANETAQFAGGKGKGDPARFADALADLEATLDFVVRRGAGNKAVGPIVAVGSGYSAALVFVLAARHPETVGAILAFSPTDVFGESIRNSVARVKCPVFITSAAESFEIAEARKFFDAVAVARKTQATPSHGIKGASTLRADLNPLGAAESWASLEKFLGGVGRPAITISAARIRQQRELSQQARADGPDLKRIIGETSSAGQSAGASAHGEAD
jgi:dienelactone hydrolase